MAKSRILVIGNSKMDLVLKTKVFPEIGECVKTEYPYSFQPSGKGLVSATLISELGSDAILCTRVGDDLFGDKLKTLFMKNGIDVRFVVSDKKRTTGLDTIISNPSDFSRNISYSGANAFLCDDDIEQAFMSYPDAVLIHSDVPKNILYGVVQNANSMKVPVIYDPVGVNPADFEPELLGNLEIFTPNSDEVYLLTGVSPVDVESSIKACIKLINIVKCHYIVIKLGSKGSFVFDGVYSQIIPAFNTECVDRAGVGTVFNAALTHIYAQTGDIIKASAFANMASAISLSKEGEYASIPTLSEIDAFIRDKNLNFE